ncbi:acylneuraminate cytidylyltransferase family protein [Bowmanella pacifica]|uniref:Acylneuraminate cytidylyltransferase n=1 Tax=Bowmanella pacifica TaxID=502051 RepID=A0A917Z387_9ALTE|nr:acylneuraminate cytidylyltransferase family protein [Bowmanella pacifica]GGO73860.1 acylneuraminate cytidylyltransferase [Bowmanella pacifica]
MKYVAVIPARGGSKGLPGKNTMLLHNKPLVCWSIEQARRSSKIARVLVSTDCPQIAQIAVEAGAEVPELRPSHLASDTASTESVMIHVAQNWLEWQEDLVIVLLQPTSPIRLASTLDNAITYFEQQNADSLVSVCESHSFFWTNIQNPKAQYDFMNRPRRQDIQPVERLYRENGSIYLTKLPQLKKAGNRLAGRIAMYCMSEVESWEIDSITDFNIVSQLLKESGI